MTRGLRNFILAIVMGQALEGCRSIGSIDTDPKADIMELSNTYGVTENKGKGPLEVPGEGLLARYRFFRRNLEPEYLLVLYPERVQGTIKPKLSDTKAVATAVEGGGRYYDQLLHAHRMVLKGDLTSAKTMLHAIDAEFDPSYGTQVLLGNVLLLEGNLRDALVNFESALAFDANDANLKSVVASLKGVKSQ